MESTLSQDWRRDHDYAKVQDYLHDFVGMSRKQKLMDDLSDFLYMTKLDWAYRNRVKFSPEVCLVTVTEPSTNEILDIGGTLPGDLFVDSLGSFLAFMCRQPVAAAGGTFAYNDTAGASKTLQVYHNATLADIMIGGASNATGTKMQIGSSVVAPTRADNAVGTAFGTAPESGLFNTGLGSYTAGTGTVTVSGSVTAGGAGTINEAILVWACNTSASALVNIAFAHDATTATAFIAANSITVQYSITD